MLTPREIIAEAWMITTTQKSLKRWGFFGSFFRLLLDIKLIAYQVYFAYALFIIHKEVGLFDDVSLAYNSLPVWAFVTLLISFGVLLFVEVFIPSLADGAIIGLAAKAHNKEKVSGGFILALYNFFPILAIHEIFVFSGLNLLVTAVSILLRYGSGLKIPLIIVATLLWIVSSILKFFSSFAEPGVVVQKMGIFESIGKSIKLIVSYARHVIFLVLLLLVITIRIAINGIVIILLPGIIFGIGLLLTHIVSPAISYSIAGIIGVVIVFAMAYFLAYLHVFKQTVWTITFMELSKQKELDKIG